MRGVVPAPQGFVCEFLVRVSDAAGNSSEPYLEGLSCDQLAADLKEKVLRIEGIVIDDVKGFDLRRSLAEESLKLWQHPANLPPLRASG